MRILFAAPAYWPAVAFGGPIPVERELANGLAARGHDVEVVTTSLVDARRGRGLHSRHEDVESARVHYLATPVAYRWMGFTPSLPLLLRNLRPDVVHVFGYRDPLGTAVAAWCRRTKRPYVFEPLGMFVPRFRKVRTKRVFDRLWRAAPEGANLIVATSELERNELADAGLSEERIVVRPNGFPAPTTTAAPDGLRARLGLDSTDPLVLFVGRLNRKKGLDVLLRALAGLPQATLAIVGPDDHDGTRATVERLRDELGLRERVHLVGATSNPFALYAEADVLALPSRNENFGNVAAEAAAAGTPAVISDQCGVAEFVRDRAALVVSATESDVRNAIAKVLEDDALRTRLAAEGPRVAAEFSWPNVSAMQEEIYERALS
jgi:glycosyltransferase involved in cell wall biosynthesis